MSFSQKQPKDNFKVISSTEKSDNNSSTSRSIVEKRSVQILENKDSIPFRQIDKNERITNENTRTIYYQTRITRQTVTTSNPNLVNDLMKNCILESNTETISHLTGENRETNVTYPKKPNNGAIRKNYLSSVMTNGDPIDFSKNKSNRLASYNFSNNSVDKPIKNIYESPIINRHKPITLSNLKPTNNQLRSNFFNEGSRNISTPANQTRLNNLKPYISSNTEFDASKNEVSKHISVSPSKLTSNQFPSISNNNANKPTKTKYVSAIANRYEPSILPNSRPENNQLRMNFLGNPQSPSSYQINVNKFENRKLLPKLNPGKLYIFHHYEFQNSSDNRDGSKADAELLKNTFKQFKINGDEYNNFTAKKVREKAEKISKQNFTQNSAIIIAILSHGGGMDMIHAYDDKYSINDDVLLPILSNKTLIGKPKILIVQACKGQIDLRDYDTDSSPRVTKFLTPDEIFKFYSTSEGFVSLRDRKTGSIFIKAFCAEVARSGHSKCIRSIMDDVTGIVKEITNGKQIPSMCVNNTAPYILGKYV